MNNKLSISYLILIVVPFFFGCSGSVKGGGKNNVSASSLSLHVGDGRYLAIDTSGSTVTWKGASLMGANAHTGYVHISKGELMIEKGQLKGGTVEVDMNTIEDKNHERDNKLIDHLKNPDFFDVEKFPFSTIAITKVAPISGGDKNVTGNLTIKGITHPVTFAARVEIKDGAVKANGRLVIDRSKWDVRYKSRKFYDLLANQTISDSIEFDVRILAKK